MSRMRLNSAMKLYYPGQNSAMKLISYTIKNYAIQLKSLCIIIWQLTPANFLLKNKIITASDMYNTSVWLLKISYPNPRKA